MTTFKDTLPPAQEAFAMNLHSGGHEVLPGPTGTFIITLTDAETGEVLQHFEKNWTGPETGCKEGQDG